MEKAEVRFSLLLVWLGKVTAISERELFYRKHLREAPYTPGARAAPPLPAWGSGARQGAGASRLDWKAAARAGNVGCGLGLRGLELPGLESAPGYQLLQGETWRCAVPAIGARWAVSEERPLQDERVHGDGFGTFGWKHLFLCSSAEGLWRDCVLRSVMKVGWSFRSVHIRLKTAASISATTSVPPQCPLRMRVC